MHGENIDRDIYLLPTQPRPLIMASRILTSLSLKVYLIVAIVTQT